MDRKKLGAAALGAAGAIAVAIGALDRGEKIDCSEAAATTRLRDFEDRFAGCVKRDDVSCVTALDAEFNRTLEACKKP